MALPQQVLDAEAEAHRIQEGIALPDAENPEAPAPVEEPAPAPVVPAPEPTPETPAPADSEATWEARYKTLQGMFKAEVPRLREEVLRLTTALAEANRKLEQRVEPPAPEPRASETKLGSAKDAEDFGGDLVDMVRRQAVDAARAEFGGEIARLEALNKDLEGKLNGVSEVQTVSAQERYMNDLAKMVPDYLVVNEDPLFLAWLDQEDVLSGEKRQQFFNRAYRGLDAERTAKLMLAFKDSLRTEPQVTTPAPVAQPVAPVETPADRLARQVQPVPSRADSAPAPSNAGKIYSMAEIEGFYREITQGVYRGREAEQARIEAEIDAAVAEGRLK